MQDSKEEGEETSEKKAKKEEEEEDEDEGVLDDEPTLTGGLGSALELLKRRGVFNQKQKKEVGEVIIERLDENGREMSLKQAFKKMSHVYHGEAPSLRKREKQQKKEREEEKRKFVSPTDTPLGTVGKMREAQARLGQAYIVLEKKITASDLDRQIEKRIQKQGVEPGKGQGQKKKPKGPKGPGANAAGAGAGASAASEETAYESSLVNPKKRKQVGFVVLVVVCFVCCCCSCCGLFCLLLVLVVCRFYNHVPSATNLISHLFRKIFRFK